VIGKLDDDMPAIKAGMKEGDRVVAMDGKQLGSIDAMIEQLQQTKNKPVDLTVLRGDQTLSFQVNPVLSKTEDPKQERYRLGFLNKETTTVKSLPFGQALSLSIQDNKKYSVLLLELAKKLVEGKVSPKMVSGPIGIAQEAGYAAQQKGWSPLLALTSSISLNLGVFNLLPIPILDGGVIFFLLIESIMRHDISLRIKERVYQAAFVFLILFAVMVIYNDLLKTIPGLAERLQ